MYGCRRVISAGMVAARAQRPRQTGALSHPVVFPNASHTRLVLNSKQGSSNGRDIARPSPHCSGSDAAPRCPAGPLTRGQVAVTQATAKRMRADHHVRKSLVTSSGRAAGARPLRGDPQAGCLLPASHRSQARSLHVPTVTAWTIALEYHNGFSTLSSLVMWVRRGRKLQEAKCFCILPISGAHNNARSGMLTARIEGGPSWNVLVRRMFSSSPVTFVTTNGPFEVLIDEMRELDGSGDRLSFFGRMVSIQRPGGRVSGDYDCLRKTGRLTAPSFS